MSRDGKSLYDERVTAQWTVQQQETGCESNLSLEMTDELTPRTVCEAQSKS